LILATNVAETSLTIPRIACVIDSGVARISRWSPGKGVQRLLVEPVSQASARQRKVVADGFVMAFVSGSMKRRI